VLVGLASAIIVRPSIGRIVRGGDRVRRVS
jgi:hypothetical protein